MNNKLHIRHAGNGDINDIHILMQLYAAAQIVLPRSRSDIQQYLNNFRIAEVDGSFAGCVAIRDFGEQLFEIRSLAVKPELTGQRIGSQMISALVNEFSARGPCRLFALTYRANFFLNLGFAVVDKKLFPQKIWSDCANCPKKDHCDEVAVLLKLPAPDAV